MITAKKFYGLLIDVLKESEKITVDHYWNATDTSVARWTTYLSRAIEEDILQGELKLKTNREYFRIDLIGWSGNPAWQKENEKHIGSKPCKRDSDPQLNEYHWNLEIAVEYENDSLDWTNEVIKLCHIKCGLKVVIGYAHYEQRENDMAKLNIIADHMRKLKYGCPQKGEEFLVILGNCGRGEPYKSIDNDIQSKAYIYNGTKFEPLKR